VNQLFANSVFGIYLGAAYAIVASGLVLTYTTTRVFNLSHGATSMVMAFLYWQLHVHEGLPTWLSLVLVLLVAAPLFGIVLERLVMRGLGEAPVSVSLVVTVAMFLMLVGLAMQLWPHDVVRSVNYFFGYRTVTVFGTRIGYHYLITIAISAVVAVALYVLLNRTRMGTAMRGAVDNPDLLELFGSNAIRVSMISWALGSMLAALGGVLLVAYTGLDYYTLTFLVIASFAAAMLGRLSSLPLTYAGALALGLGTSYLQNYLHTSSPYIQTGLQSSLPTFMLFAILVFAPQTRLRVGQVKGILAARVPSMARSVQAAIGLVAVAAVVAATLNPTDQLRFGIAAAYAIVMLSLVLLTGYGGYVSLAQFSFVGVGAATVAKSHSSSPFVIVLAVVIAAAVGALVSLPVLRLTGLYLALATLAFGQLMDKMVFQADFLFRFGGTLEARRMSLFGYDFSSTAQYVVFMVAVFAVLAIALLWIRRGAIGRMLIALRDSPAACGTLGLSQRWFRVAVFSTSAGVAGLAGALLAGLERFVSPTDFQTLNSLPLLLVAVVAGVTSMSGAFLGGVLLMLVPVLQTTNPNYAGVVFLVIAVGAILLSRDPNGIVNLAFTGTRRAAGRVPRPTRRDAALAGFGDVEHREGAVAPHGVA
jgi:branched-chain amino acid transport system permease protein